MRLYHFTSAKYGLDAIRNQRYKLSTFDNLNDPFELLATGLADAKIRFAFRRFKELCAKEMAILCCSKSWSSTLLWSHYAEKHSGLALQLDVHEERITHVEYKQDRKQVTRQDMDEYMRCNDGKGIGAEMLRVKARDWAYEEEARIFHSIGHLRRPENGLYFFPFDEQISLRGVILGPLCTITLKELQDHLPSGISLTVRKSRLAFQSFKVTRDISFETQVLTGA